jgi:hypothetical protein
MKPKQILAVALLVFVVASLAYMVGKEQKSDSVSAEDANGSASVEQSRRSSTNEQDTDAHKHIQLMVYYFHGDMRCPTCHKLETYAKEALDTYFADKIASKDIVWKVVNVDRVENRHFIQDYKLVTKSVVISETVNGEETRWKNLEQIWQLVRNKESYLNYIRESISTFLREGK